MINRRVAGGRCREEGAAWLGPGARAVSIAALMLAAAWTWQGRLHRAPDARAVTDAVAIGDVEGVRRALDAGACADGDDGNPLLLAAANGDDASTALLLAHGADASRVSVGGYTPLMMATVGGNPQVVEMLLDHGADPNQSTSSTQTPLAIAALFGHERMVEVLLVRGARAGGVNGDAKARHDPPLVCAARSGEASAALVGRLIAAGADVNAPDADGVTPLIAATESGRDDLVVVLLRAGARRHPTRLAAAPHMNRESARIHS